MVPYQDLPIGLVDHNLTIFHQLLDNQNLSGINDMVCIKGYHAAKKVIRCGDMKRKYQDFKAFCDQFAS